MSLALLDSFFIVPFFLGSFRVVLEAEPTGKQWPPAQPGNP